MNGLHRLIDGSPMGEQGSGIQIPIQFPFLGQSGVGVMQPEIPSRHPTLGSLRGYAKLEGRVPRLGHTAPPKHPVRGNGGLCNQSS